MERDKLAVWQNSSDLERQDLRLRRLSAVWEVLKEKPKRSLESEN